MQRHLRLHSRQDFARSRQAGRVVQDQYLKLSIVPSPLAHHRYGFIISGRLGKAVQRNKLRRRLREIVRLLDPQIPLRFVEQPDQSPSGYDMVWIAKPAAMQAEFDVLSRSVVQLLQRAKLIDHVGE